MWSHQLYLFFTSAFRKPFRTAPWIVLLYIVIAVIYNPNTHFNKWTLPDTDDYMRLNQVFNWLDGHGWADLTVERLNPQHPFTMHWARLVDVPLAGAMIILQAIAHFFQWNADRANLGMLAAFIVPSFLLAVLLFMVRSMAQPLTGRAYAALACFMVPLSQQLLFQFAPMRVDHHAYIILCAGAAFIALLNIALHIRPPIMAVLAAWFIALGMWNGAEILPMFIGFSFCLTLLMLDKKKPDGTGGVVFGAALLVFTGLLLYAVRPADKIFSMEYDAFSFFYVLLGAGAFVFFTLLYLASRLTTKPIILLPLCGFMGISGLWLFLHYFPDFILGPYAKVNPLLTDVFFPNIREAIPMLKNMADLKDGFGAAPSQTLGGAIHFVAVRLFLPATAIAMCLYHLFKNTTPARQKKIWALYGFFAAGFTLLAIFWQIRVITYAQLFSIAPVVHTMLLSLRSLRQHHQGRVLYGLEILTVMAFSVLPIVMIPAIINNSKFNPDMLFVVPTAGDMPCKDRTKITSFLNDHGKKEGKIYTIMAPIDYTPELLYLTPHNYISAPYHRNDKGIVDMVFFFRSKKDDAPARKIAHDLNLDYVLTCKNSPFQGTLDPKPEIKHTTINVTMDAVTSTPSDDDLTNGSLAIRLSYKKIPTWLERVYVPMETDFLLFEVKKDKLNRPSAYPKD